MNNVTPQSMREITLESYYTGGVNITGFEVFEEVRSMQHTRKNTKPVNVSWYRTFSILCPCRRAVPVVVDAAAVILIVAVLFLPILSLAFLIVFLLFLQHLYHDLHPHYLFLVLLLLSLPFLQAFLGRYTFFILLLSV